MAKMCFLRFDFVLNWPYIDTEKTKMYGIVHTYNRQEEVLCQRY